jgi:predicted amidohydrolase
MRILLAALNAPKGDLDANLASHAAALEQARVQGCQVAVFPEFSLTGGVDFPWDDAVADDDLGI